MTANGFGIWKKRAAWKIRLLKSSRALQAKLRDMDFNLRATEGH